MSKNSVTNEILLDFHSDIFDADSHDKDSLRIGGVLIRESLGADLLERVASVTSLESSGIVLFKVALDQVMFMNASTIRTLSNRLGGLIFCDVAAGFAKCYPQISTGAFETIHGVQVKAYRADNGLFSKEDFMDEIKAEGQRITFSGVGAHHMNGVAERSTRTTITKSRTMMLQSEFQIK